MAEHFKNHGDQVRRSGSRLFDVVRVYTLVKKAFQPPAKPDEKLTSAKDALLLQRSSSNKSVPFQRTFSRLDTIRRQDALSSAKETTTFYSENESGFVLDKLCVNADKGLTSEEAAARLLIHGRNELEKDPPRPFWKLFLDQFKDLLVILLFISAVVSMALGSYAASIFIFLIVMANAAIGVKMEAKASADLDALQSSFNDLADVLRDGKRVSVPSPEVVPGDIIFVVAGSAVVADIRLLESNSLAVDEAKLTGESEPVKKHAVPKKDKDGLEEKEEKSKAKKEEELTENNMIFVGCAVVDGNAKGVVVRTGMQSKMGEIAEMLKSAEQGESPLQQKLTRLGFRLGLASIAVSTLVFIIGVTTERGTDPSDDRPVWLQIMLISVSLIVAAVPEGLPAAVTISLAIGMYEMVQRKANIRNLHSVETLGSASIICSDKTGTLTKGEMTAVRLWFHGDTFKFTGQGYEPKGTLEVVQVSEETQKYCNEKTENVREGPHILPLKVALMCSDATVQLSKRVDDKGNTQEYWEARGLLTERPLIVAGTKLGITDEYIKKNFPEVHVNPFQSSRKMMSKLLDLSKGGDEVPKIFGGAPYVSAVKGAPNYILKACTHVVDGNADDPSAVRAITEDDQKFIFEAIDNFSGEAFRVLAMAYKPLDNADEKGPENLENGLIFAGMVASIDPERPEVIPSIRTARSAGIRTVMITGDYVKTARAIAENIGLLQKTDPDSKAVDCAVVRKIDEEIKESEQKLESAPSGSREALQYAEAVKVAQRQLDSITAFTNVYARAKPSDKIAIVTSLQRQGHVCSMTGDGVNDAPALRKANIGVAMGITGTDVAKSAADMVLVDDNFCHIVEAIEQGRTIYANIVKFVFYLLSTNVAEVFVILIAVIAGMQAPLNAVQILWLNLTTDGAPAVALAFEKLEPGVMNEGPRPQTEGIIEKVMITGVVIQTIFLTAIVLFTYMLGLYWEIGAWDGVAEAPYEYDGVTYLTEDSVNDFVNDGTKVARTMTIYMIVFAELLRAYGSRSLRNSTFTLGVFSNNIMQISVSISIGATILVGNIPGLNDVFGMVFLDFKHWAWILTMCWIPFIIDEITKYFYRMTGFGVRPKITDDDMILKQVERQRSLSGLDQVTTSETYSQQPATRIMSGDFSSLNEIEEKAL